MKNKEIEELLNELKDVAERHTIEIREYGAVETIPSSISKELRLNSYSANLLLSHIEQLEKRIYKARKMMFDNYGVLDKYEIEMLDDILKGDSDDK